MIKHRIAYGITLLTGLLMIFIGVRFLVMPELAEHAFGIHVNTQRDFSFHYIKGIRDLFSGICLVVLLLCQQYRALGMVLLCASIIPATDAWVVASHTDYQTAALYPHLTALLIAILVGIYYVSAKRYQSVS